MDGLTLNIIDGNKAALALAKTCITTPMLINIDITQGVVYAVPLDVETNQKQGHAEVSESLVIATDSKQYISDNVAPGSRTWNLSGYIVGVPQLEPTNYFQPFVQLHTDILWNWFMRGALLIYKDGNSQVYENVVIQDLKTAQQKDSANATPVTITLKEINVMNASPADVPDNEILNINKFLKSLPARGTALGASLTLGVTATEVVDGNNQAQSA
jgi:hypothetical protein